jgi:hypothetical protein
MSRLVHGLAWLVVVALLAPAMAVAGCTAWGDYSYEEQQPFSSVSSDETQSPEGTAVAWNVAGREDTRSTECISGPLSSTNKPGMPQSNTWVGGNPVLAPSLVMSLSPNPVRVTICPAVLGVQR